MTDTPKFDPILLPVLRNVIPNLIAQELCSVQPMTTNMINPFTKKWDRIGMDMPTNKCVFNILSQEIREWIEKQPAHMWTFYDIPIESMKGVSFNSLIGQNYLFTDEMESWFLLRWS